MKGAHMPNDAAGAQGEAMPREKSCRADELVSLVGTHGRTVRVGNRTRTAGLG